MTKGEIREQFFGDKTAVGKRELAYFPADSMFMGWQQLLLTMDRSKQQDKMAAQQAQAQQQQADQQNQMQGQQHSREQEAHDMEMEQIKARQAHAAAAHDSLKDNAKQFGAGSKPLETEGGMVANPINSDLADET
jgi:hypothetical protein